MKMTRLFVENDIAECERSALMFRETSKLYMSKDMELAKKYGLLAAAYDSIATHLKSRLER